MEDLPRNLSRPARGLLAWMWGLADDTTGEVKGREKTEHRPEQSAQAVLGQATGCTLRQVRDHLDELEAHRLIARLGATRGQRLFVLVLGKSEVAPHCPVCGSEPSTLRGQKHCPVCFQVNLRDWKADLWAIWRNGKRLGWTDERIAYAAHGRLKQPLWGRSEEGVAGSGSGSGEGIVPAGVALGIFPASMMERARRARKGEEGE